MHIALVHAGVEGLGLSAQNAQFPALDTTFEVYCMTIHSTDRSTFADLTAAISIFLTETQPERKAVVVGESFGGVLALSVAAQHPELIESTFVINPAT